MLKKLKGLSAMSRMEPDVVGQIIDGLFPQHPPPMVTLPMVEEDGISLLGTEEVDAAVNRLRGKYWEAPGPDEIPNPVWSAIHSVDPALLVDTFNAAVVGGLFPVRWKKARLALIDKKDKPPGLPSSYRPLCLLDNVGKLLERVIVNRLESYLKERDIISNSRYGLKTGLCTSDTGIRLKRIAESAIATRQFCAAVSLDIRNAFNSIPWERILEALKDAEVPAYLLRMISSYSKHRRLLVQ